MEWLPPPENKQHGDIVHYKLYYVNQSRQDSDASVINIDDPNEREYVIDKLEKWTEYRVWMRAGTIVGDGVASDPTSVRTDEDGENLLNLIRIIYTHEI